MHAFRHEESDFGSILKPEVELMVFLRMRSNKITKNGEKALKMQFGGLIYRAYMFFGTRNPNLKVHFETESRFNGVSAHAQQHI